MFWVLLYVFAMAETRSSDVEHKNASISLGMTKHPKVGVDGVT